MFLSRLMLNARSRQVQSEVRAPEQMHKTLSRAFPGLNSDELRAARVLFRVEEDEHKGVWRVLVQSRTRPDWSELGAIPHYLERAPDLKEWTPSFEDGQRLRFRLLANPTFRRCAEGPDRKAAGNAPRRGLFREAERLDWLKNQAASHGFAYGDDELKSMTWRGTTEKPVWFRGRALPHDLKLDVPLVTLVDLNDGQRFALPKQAVKHSFSAAQFDGTLIVENAATFAHAVENGIGPAKGYGFGLLSVARA